MLFRSDPLSRCFLAEPRGYSARQAHLGRPAIKSREHRRNPELLEDGLWNQSLRRLARPRPAFLVNPIMQPSRRDTMLLGKLRDSQPATAIACQDPGNLCGRKMLVLACSVTHPDSLSPPAVLNRVHPSYRLRSSTQPNEQGRLLCRNWRRFM